MVEKISHFDEAEALFLISDETIPDGDNDIRSPKSIRSELAKMNLANQ